MKAYPNQWFMERVSKSIIVKIISSKQQSSIPGLNVTESLDVAVIYTVINNFFLQFAHSKRIERSVYFNHAIKDSKHSFKGNINVFLPNWINKIFGSHLSPWTWKKNVILQLPTALLWVLEWVKKKKNRITLRIRYFLKAIPIEYVKISGAHWYLTSIWYESNNLTILLLSLLFFFFCSQTHWTFCNRGIYQRLMYLYDALIVRQT